MENNQKNIRLTALHFSILFVLLFVVAYGMTFAEMKRQEQNISSLLIEKEDVHFPEMNDEFSFILFYQPDNAASVQMEKHLSVLASDFGKEATYYKVNGMEYESVCMEHTISGFPSVLILKNGVEVKRILGVTSYKNLKYIYKKVK